MILPNKHTSLSHSILGSGAFILNNLNKPRTITNLWDKSRDKTGFKSYWRFILVLDFLYAIKAIDYIDGLIIRKSNDKIT
jgi:hypothetical protein